jgi:hypothetical protein
VQPPPTEAPTASDKPLKKAGERPVDPQKALARAATACRRQHKATDGPKVVVDYAIAGDGTVTRAVPSTRDALGDCLADAVKRTKFAPEFKLGQKIEL